MKHEPVTYLVRTHVRVALGSQPLKDWQPDAPCAYCWPALVQADKYDLRGNACCYVCAQQGAADRMQPDRRRVA
jgi:hypothetical protein